ncbi:hypothetical protein NGA_0077200 [Nannochloropsis gaditana CCMP526]|uniref:uncharacterized protein n=1 Tax=Nannochloropsis gaditana (strain CCMP526) TaxID=1093141 RepID=UPI00029F6FFC|nr:hypothetical protein NGA_0077200 [Nannochloropsis gaditana CCMP526]EKU20982.1 hypothetical protein NGA_0077200 [Nannochloropsis gaditana CCMP526]|eukprot:XP_005855383.1 hypothetical protein NGA_0077200 [Nannochloropsis gaditana CCMP526]
MTPEWGPTRLKTLKKRERSRILAQRMTGRPLVWLLLRYSPMAEVQKQTVHLNAFLTLWFRACSILNSRIQRPPAPHLPTL